MDTLNRPDALPLIRGAPKNICLSMAAVLFAIAPCTASAGIDQLKQLSAIMQNCYVTAASAYGAGKCDPPATLISAVHGKCAKEEADVLDHVAIENGAKDSLTEHGMEVAALREIKSKLDPKIESWILDAQIKGGGCQHPGG